MVNFSIHANDRVMQTLNVHVEIKGFVGFVKEYGASTTGLTGLRNILYSLDNHNPGETMLDLLLVSVIVFVIFGLLFFVFTIKSRVKGEPPRIHTCHNCNCDKSREHASPIQDLETIIGSSQSKMCNEGGYPDHATKSS